MSVLLETNLPIPLLHRGKVRDNYDLGDRLLIVASDRISAFDAVLPCGIPDKGAVLNLISAFWFQKTSHIVPNHLLEVIKDASRLKAYCPGDYEFPEALADRSMVVRKAERIDIECVVRGYMSGSAWSEYSRKGTVNGVRMRPGMLESEEFPEPIFTPTTKAESGHDQPLSLAGMSNLVGENLARELREVTTAVYRFAEGYARTRGIIIADTKMEFGLVDGETILIDELLTPDSSRFWDAGRYSMGRSQPSYDKQMVRDWLTASGWNKEPPAPMLPEDLIRRTSERYQEAYRILTGSALYQ
jgi:phosphoribosylaminoimidazole-succinocarboxamide synthase